MTAKNDSPDERIAQIIGRWSPYGRSGLLPCLQEIQDLTGWLSQETCRLVAEGLRVPLADVYGVITFYGLLYDKPVGRLIIRLCDDVACLINGNKEILRATQEYLGIQPGETTPDGMFTLEVHPCLGHCEIAPFMLINDEPIGPVRPEDIPDILEQARRAAQVEGG